jgi:hypothetical protein
MGLRITHGCWPTPGLSAGYGHFHKFRCYLASIAGYSLVKHDHIDIPVPDLDYCSYTHGNYLGYWDTVPSDILIVLLIHYDCKGWIFKEYTNSLAERLTQLADRDKIIKCIDDNHIKDRFEYFENVSSFIRGLEKASKRCQKITFS